MSIDAPALIGPNAVLQLAWAGERRLGVGEMSAILSYAGLERLPSGETMIAEGEVLRLHGAIAAKAPHLAERIAIEAGQGTADYIIAHRIPAPARTLLRILPPTIAGPLLMHAIRRHAWTFAGAGRFASRGSRSFSIHREGGARTPQTLFVWYAAVFERLFSALLRADYRCDAVDGAEDYRDYRLVRNARGRAAKRSVRKAA